MTVWDALASTLIAALPDRARDWYLVGYRDGYRDGAHEATGYETLSRRDRARVDALINDCRQQIAIELETESEAAFQRLERKRTGGNS